MLRRRMMAQLGATVSLVSFATLAGCQQQIAASSGHRTVSPGDFADHAEPLANDTPKAAQPTHEPVDEAIADDAPGMADDQPTAVTSAAPTPIATAKPANATSASTQPAAGSQRLVVDSLIGQVNGRPIFADEFFEPIEDYILAAREQMPPRDFLVLMDNTIKDRLRVVIFNELVLAEAEAGLTEDMRVGLRYWLKDVEEKKVAENRGVRARAEESVAAEGMTMDEFLRLRKDEALIYKLVSEKIEPKVIVTWRDLEREYERRKAEFCPPASITLDKIVLNKENEAAAIEAVNAGLAEGKSLKEISATLERSSAYSEDHYQLGPNGRDDLPLNEKILEAVKPLEVGETCAPQEIKVRAVMPGDPERTSVYWYSVLEVTQAEPRTLYDPTVQRQLYNELYSRRLKEEQDRYLDSLMSKGIFDSVDEMANRLRDVAILRYARR